MGTWKFTAKISMDCDQQQYEKFLKPELLKMGYNLNICQWGEKTVIVNNFNLTNGVVNNPDYICRERNDRTYIGSFNAPLFLALAAMTDKPEGGYAEYWVEEILPSLYWPFVPRAMKPRWTIRRTAFDFTHKATVSEIMEKFGEKKQVSEGEMIREGFNYAMKWANEEYEKKNQLPIAQAVPYQLCPKCEGEGKIRMMVFGTYHYKYKAFPCEICNGKGIIPMHVIK